MKLSKKHKYILAALAVYWVAMFTATHIPSIPGMVYKSMVRDFTLHFGAYFCLTFLIWQAISPFKKVDFRQVRPWLVLTGAVWYGVFDEFSQQFTGRSCEFLDFTGDMTGVITGLIILSLFSFKRAALVYSLVIMYCVNNASHADMLGADAMVNAAAHLCGYGLVAILWVYNLGPIAPGLRAKAAWLIMAIVFPAGFLMINKGLGVFTDKHIYTIDIATGLTGVLSVVAAAFLTGMFTGRNPEESEPLLTETPAVEPA